MCIHTYIYIYIYVYTCSCSLVTKQVVPRGLSKRCVILGSSGMWCLRMWGLKLIVYWPSTTEGVGTSHLKLIWVRGLKHSSLKPHILKHHIPEHPISGSVCTRISCTCFGLRRTCTALSGDAPDASNDTSTPETYRAQRADVAQKSSQQGVDTGSESQRGDGNGTVNPQTRIPQTKNLRV